MDPGLDFLFVLRDSLQGAVAFLSAFCVYSTVQIYKLHIDLHL